MLGTTRRIARRAVLAGAALASVLAAGLVSRSAAAVQPAACPARAVARVPANGWSAARRELIPGAPGALRLCRYGGVNSTLPLALARSRLLIGRAPIARLTSEFDALPPAPRIPLHCPSEDGSEIVVSLAYSAGERVTLAVQLTGCRLVSNGDLTRIANGYESASVARSLYTELLALTAPVHGSARVSGAVRLCGGPAPSHCHTQDAGVTVLDAAGEVVAAARTAAARFSFALPAGTYTLVAATGGASGRRAVVLTAGRTRRADIVVPIR